MQRPRSIIFTVLALLFSLPYAISAQTSSKPAQAPPAFSPPAAHENAPLGDIPRFPGNGNGAYETHEYPDLFGALDFCILVPFLVLRFRFFIFRSLD